MRNETEEEGWKEVGGNRMKSEKKGDERRD